MSSVSPTFPTYGVPDFRQVSTDVAYGADALTYFPEYFGDVHFMSCYSWNE